MRLNRMVHGVLLAIAAAAALTGCGRTRTGTEVVVQESETEARVSANTPATQEEVKESETEPETVKLITSVEYTSKDGTVKITLPDNTWKVTQDADEMRVFSSGSEAMINIVHASTDSAMKTLSIQKTEEDLKAALTRQYSDAEAYDIQKFEQKTIDKVNVYRYIVKYNAAARMWAYSVTYGIVAQDQAYVITGTVTDDNSTLLKAVEDSVDSFTVLKDEELKNITSSALQGTTTAGETTPAATTSTQEAATLTAYSAVTTMFVNDIVNVRSGPGTDTEVIGGYGIGDAVMVTGETANWYQISMNGTTGYIRKDFLAKSQTQTQQAETPDTSGAEASGESATAYNYGYSVTMYTTDGVNVRSGPSTGSGISGTLNSGTSVTVIGETDNWFIVSTGAGTGYISKSYLTSTAPSGGGSTGSTSGDGSSGSSSSGGGSGWIGGTVTGSTADTITITADNGNSYTIYTGEADITTSTGLYSGLYVSVSYHTNADGSMSASSVTG